MSYSILPIQPSYDGSSLDTTARVLKNTFGDGYAQTAQDGINNIVGGPSLTWSALTLAQKQSLVDNFFVVLAGSTPFFWTPPGTTVALLWKCAKWSVIPLKCSIPPAATDTFRVTATFEQSFDVTP